MRRLAARCLQLAARGEPIAAARHAVPRVDAPPSGAPPCATAFTTSSARAARHRSTPHGPSGARPQAAAAAAAAPAAAPPPPPPPPPPWAQRLKDRENNARGIFTLAGAGLLLGGLVGARGAVDAIRGDGGDAAAPAPHDGGPPRPALLPSAGGDSLSLQAAYLLQQWLQANAAVKIGALVLGAVPVAGLLGLVYARATGQKAVQGFAKVYQVLYRMPGAMVTQEPNAVASALAQLTFLFGLFGFAVVLGIAGDEVKQQLHAVREGNYPVIHTGHTVVLNANKHLVPLLHQLAAARGKHSTAKELSDRPIVVLQGDGAKRALDEALNGELEGCGLSLATRYGQPYLGQDLERVSAGAARTVIILAPEDLPLQESMHRLVATLLALLSLREAALRAGHKLPPQNVVIQTRISEPVFPELDMRVKDTIAAACEAAGMHTVLFTGASNVERIMAQAALQPGLSDVYTHLVEPSADSIKFKLRAFEFSAGRAYGEVRQRFPEAVVIGYQSADGRTHLNPADADMLGDDVKLLALSRGGKFSPSDAPAPVAPLPAAPSPGPRRGAAGAPRPRGKSVVVLGWEDDARSLVSGLAEFAPPGSTVVFAGPSRPAGLPSQLLHCRFRHLPGQLNDMQLYRDACVDAADAVIIGGFKDVSEKEADARVLSVLMLAQSYLCGGANGGPAAAARGAHAAAGGPPRTHCVTMLHSPDTARTAHHIIGALGRGCLSCEVLYPNELVGGLLSQVAAEPDLAHVMREMIETEEGMEIYVRSPEHYGLPVGSTVTFAQVADAARRRGETALGLLRGGSRGAMQLCPHALSSHALEEGTRVIALAED